MQQKEIQHLCDLSRLNYDGEALEQVAAEMTSIIALMDEIKAFDLSYDDTRDYNSIPLSEVRGDAAQSSMPAEKLLSNARSIDGCFVVPKVVE